jgi:Putative cell-wall binding lipoprotein
VKFIEKKRLLLFAFILIIALAGCAAKQNDPVEKMYGILENVVSKEKAFEKQQEPLVDLEKKEKSLYDQILKLGMKEHNQIVQLADEALASADERKNHFETETESLKQSETQFRKVETLKDKFKDEQLRKLADELYVMMMNRYRSHDELYKLYTKAIQNDKELYGMFKNKDVPLEDLENQVKKVNESYQNVYAENEKFNKYTEGYNDKKLSFYKKAGLKPN